MAAALIMLLNVVAAVGDKVQTGQTFAPPCGMTIEFVTPGNWQCAHDDSAECATCRNLGSQIGELIIRCDAGGAGERRQVSPGEELAVCCGANRPI